MAESRADLIAGVPLLRDREVLHKRSYRWVILALLWLLYAAFGLIFRAMPPLVTPILEELHLSYAQMGLILGSWALTYILVAIIAGAIIDRWGVRRSILVGTLIIGLSAALRYFPNGFNTMLMAVALFGVGGPMISIGGPKSIAMWFQGKSRSTAIGIYMTGHWIGGLIALAITNSLIMPFMGYSWRLTFVFYGSLVFLVALLWVYFARDTKPRITMSNASVSEVFRQLAKTRNVQILLIMGLLSFATMHGFTNWLPRILENDGLTPVLAGYTASIPIAAAIPATLMIPRLIPAHLRGRLIALFALLTVTTIFIVVETQGAVLLAGLVLFGVASSCFLPLLLLMLMDTLPVGSRHMGVAGGMFFSISEIGGFAGPLIMGALVDITGAFLTGALFLMAMNLAIIALALLFKAVPTN
ncbi:CynX/NimT family MFS transporter [Chloroflexota bacterium]